jgi:sodium-dependent dicarboxylate transporter 2/3/5
MAMTALLSMFVSNTATAATMFAVLTPVLATAPPGRTRTGLALSIPIAANVGGLATPVGSPPNAIAVAALSNDGYPVTFAQWMVFGLPLMIILLLFSWLLLSKMFIDPAANITFDVQPRFDTTGKAIAFYVIAALTVLGWLTEALHGIPASTVGFFAVVALLAVGSITPNELGKLPWAVLWLVAGGIALGTGLAATGIDAWIVALVDWSVLSPTALIAVIAVLAVGLSTVISNSATANLLVPIGIALAVSVDTDPIVVAVAIALACSLAMAMPISTPPNAVAYATGQVSTRNMALTGVIIGAVGIPLIVWLIPMVVPAFS